MALPPDIPPITITTGNGFVDATGALANGTITFSIPTSVNDITADQVVLQRDVVGTVINGVLQDLNADGPLQLLPTNHPNMTQRGWTYEVTEAFDAVVNRAPYAIAVPYDSPGLTVDLAKIIVGATPSGGSVQLVTGPAGLSVLTGDTPPSNTIGVSGQAYIDTAHAVLYKKVGSAWNAGVSLAGTGGGGGAGTVTQINGISPDVSGHVTITATDIANAARVDADIVNVKNQANPLANAIMDGSSHPVSGRFALLADAQNVFGSGVSLSDEIDYWAIQSALSANRAVYMPPGTAVINKAIMIPAGGNRHLEGAGELVTELFIRTSANCTAIDCVDVVNANPNITLRNFSINGNKANNTATIGQTSGMHIVRGDNFKLSNVEVYNMNGRGIWASGVTGSVCQVQHWMDVYSHGNMHWGIWTTNGVRKAQYANITCNFNGTRTDISRSNSGNNADSFTGGFLLDHSESSGYNIQCHNNGQYGLWIRNVFSCNISGIRATQNQGTGIRVLGMVDSVSNEWLSQGNGTDITQVADDIWFDGTSTLNYGKTSRTKIGGILAGPSASAGIATQGSWVGNERYAINFDDAMGSADLEVKCKVYSGYTDTIRMPATVTSLQVDPGTGTFIDNTPPTSPPSLAYDPNLVGDTTAVVTWSASTDNVKVTGYRMYYVLPNQGGGGGSTIQLFQAVPATQRTMNLTGLQAGQINTVQLTAVDGSGNESPPSSLDILTSGGTDTTAPTVPGLGTGQGAVLVTGNKVGLAWTASTDTQSGVDHYNIRRGGTIIGTSTGTTYTDSTVAENTIYSYTISAVDGIGNESPQTAGIPVSTPLLVHLRGEAHTVATANTTGPIVTIPASGASAPRCKDLMLLIGTCASGQSIPTPSGWTIVPGTTVVTAGNEEAAYFYRVAAGTDPTAISADAGTTVQFTNTSTKTIAQVLIWYNTDGTTPIVEALNAAETTSTLTHTMPGITTLINNCRILGILTEHDPASNITNVTPPSGWTSPGGLLMTGGASQQVMYTALDPNSEPPNDFGGSGSGLTFVTDVATVNAVMGLLAIAPVGSAAVDTSPPTQVTGVQTPSANIQQTQLTLKWNAATDNSGTIQTYQIWGHPAGGDGSGTVKADTRIKTVAGGILTTVISGLTANTEYPFAVSAIDAAGNEGPKSGTLRPVTASSGGNTGTTVFGLQASGGVNTLALRNAANGWVATDGTVLVDSSGNGINLGMTRIYYPPGSFPTAFSVAATAGGGGVNTSKRVEVCWKGNTGFTNFQDVMNGGADVAFCRFINSIPAGWREVCMTFHHEPNSDWNTTNNTPAQYKGAQMRLGALLENRAMPAGQPAKAAGAAAVSIPSGCLVYNGICFTVPRSSGDNDWGNVQNAIPLASQMDARAILVLDAYQNPPPPITQALGGGGVNALYPTPAAIWSYYFASIHSQYGYDTAGHGYGIGEWMAPLRDNDNATHDGQTNAISTYITYLMNHSAGPPRIFCMWENKNSLTDSSGAKFNQTAYAGAKKAFCDAATGPKAIIG
jgi:chitodextrinase